MKFIQLIELANDEDTEETNVLRIFEPKCVWKLCGLEKKENAG